MKVNLSGNDLALLRGLLIPETINKLHGKITLASKQGQPTKNLERLLNEVIDFRNKIIEEAGNGQNVDDLVRR